MKKVKRMIAHKLVVLKKKKQPKKAKRVQNEYYQITLKFNSMEEKAIKKAAKAQRMTTYTFCKKETLATIDFFYELKQKRK